MATDVLFLCTGNTCRSPVAEVLARRLFGNLELAFLSAGLDARSGLPASPESAVWATAAGASLAGHRSQPVSAGLLANTAWVIGMTRSHAAIFQSRFKAVYSGRTGVLGAPGIDLGAAAAPLPSEDVPDPYGGAPETYGLVCGRIAELLAAWEPCFKELAGRKELER
jgi:protein-tyrosine-phosphatase